MSSLESAWTIQIQEPSRRGSVQGAFRTVFHLDHASQRQHRQRCSTLERNSRMPKRTKPRTGVQLIQQLREYGRLESREEPYTWSSFRPRTSS